MILSDAGTSPPHSISIPKSLTIRVNLIPDCTGDIFTHHFVHIEHVQINSTQLQHIGVTKGLTSSHVRLEDASKLLNSLGLLQDFHVPTGLVDDVVPYLQVTVNSIIKSLFEEVTKSYMKNQAGRLKN